MIIHHFCWLSHSLSRLLKQCSYVFLNRRSEIFFFLLAGHKVDFIAPCGANKSTFWPASRKKIVCNKGKTFILLVWLLPSLCSGIKLLTRKINFFFPSCTMYYCLSLFLSELSFEMSTPNACCNPLDVEKHNYLFKFGRKAL